MSCPHCRAKTVHRRKQRTAPGAARAAGDARAEVRLDRQHVLARGQRTALGYRRFWCASCRRTFNERTGTAFNELQHPTDVVLLAMLWRLRYKLSFRDVAELLLQRGFEVTHETVRQWEFRFAPLLSEQLRTRRRGSAGASRYLDDYLRMRRRGELALSLSAQRRLFAEGWQALIVELQAA